MLNELIGMYLADKYKITTDRILFALSISANDTSSFTITDATNGAKLKADLSSLDYFATKYNIWSQNGILDVSIKPDNEAANQIKTLALTKEIEAPLIPPKYIQADLNIDITNDQAIDDDLFLSIDIYKIPQGKVQDILNIGNTLLTSPENIDIQTLAIEKYLIFTNELLKALIIANNGVVPGAPVGLPPLPTYEPAQKTKTCRRS